MIKKPQTKKGFTIIEVVLVLAIAGLIFLMVFLAFPALQRAQKDTQRRDQLSMLVTQITQYQANNRNRIPSCGSNNTNCTVVPSDDGKVSGDSGWDNFYKSYLLAQGDVFEDPNGNPYKLQIVTCATGTDGACGVQRYNWGFDSDQETKGENSAPSQGQVNRGLSGTIASLDSSFLLAADTNTGGQGKEGGGNQGPTSSNQNYFILITIKSHCDGEMVVPDTGARKVSVAYKLEGGGTFCANN